MQQSQGSNAGGSIKSKSSKEGKTKPKAEFGDCVYGVAHFHRDDGIEVDNQVAAPAETRTPNLHRAKKSLNESADGRVATA